ncbi:MAG: hypothetical protein PUC47_09290 [Oscillospiraceae bacterium]|nr:hypothetical protein [Oscillospiraceae bacterium]
MTKEEFDGLIKKNLVAVLGDACFGYVLAKKYPNYFSREAFAIFIDEMKSGYHRAFCSYDAGKGSELKEQTGRYGKTPPKMASVASSSRFCYLALRDGADGLGGSGEVEFEHECRIKGIDGIAPQLDAFIPNESIYVEVKCHEIFDAHHVVMKIKYWDLLFGVDNAFGLPNLPKVQDETFTIGHETFNLSKASTMFDIKQFLCHLLGIASRKEADKPAKLVYLFFKPRLDTADEQRAMDEVFCELQHEIRAIFASPPIRRFTEKNNIQLTAVAEYASIMERLSPHNRMMLFPV